MSKRPDASDPRGFALHIIAPLTYGGQDETGLTPPITVGVEVFAPPQPVNPGFPPLAHMPLLPPQAYQPAAPPIPASVRQAAAHTAIPSRPRIPFPVAEAPGFARTGAAVPVPEGDEEEAQAETARQIRISPTRAERPALLEKFDPIYALVLYVAAGLGSLALSGLENRYTALWTLLVILGGGLTFLDLTKPAGRITTNNLAWGLGFGFIIGLPMLIFVRDGLSAGVTVLFPYATPAGLFQTVVFLWPLAETLFFRGVLQQRRGIAVSVIGASIATTVFFWPAGRGQPVLLGLVVGFLSVLSGLYSYVRQRHGLAAAYACQVTLNVMLLFLPRVLAPPLP